MWAVSKLFLALGIVFVLLFFFIRLMKRTNLAGGDLSSDPGIRLLMTKAIAPQKYISLVEIGGEVLALGISETQITLLSKVENKEFIEKVVAHRFMRVEPFSLFPFPKRGWLRSVSLRISHGK